MKFIESESLNEINNDMNQIYLCFLPHSEEEEEEEECESESDVSLEDTRCLTKGGL